MNDETNNKNLWIWINPVKCMGCSTCVRRCPVGAIDAALIIDNSVCIRCDVCRQACRFGAISERKDEMFVNYKVHRKK